MEVINKILQTREKLSIRPKKIMRARATTACPYRTKLRTLSPARSGHEKYACSHPPIALVRFGFWGADPTLQPSPRLNKNFDIPSGVFEILQHPHTIFRRLFERGDLPVVLRHRARLSLDFKVPIENLDVAYFLPIFVDGLRERMQPFRFVASEGTLMLVQRGDSSQILSCLPELIYPLKYALESCDKPTIILALRVIQALCSSNRDISEALVKFYRQLLPVLNRYKAHKRNLGDRTDFAQFKHDGRTLGETIEDTLAELEKSGGDDALINIKYIVPTYESSRDN